MWYAVFGGALYYSDVIDQFRVIIVSHNRTK